VGFSRSCCGDCSEGDHARQPMLVDKQRVSALTALVRAGTIARFVAVRTA